MHLGESLWDHSQVQWTHVFCGNMGCDNQGFYWPEGAEPDPVTLWNTRTDLIPAMLAKARAKGIKEAARLIYESDVPTRVYLSAAILALLDQPSGDRHE